MKTDIYLISDVEQGKNRDNEVQSVSPRFTVNLKGINLQKNKHTDNQKVITHWSWQYKNKRCFY